MFLKPIHSNEQIAQQLKLPVKLKRRLNPFERTTKMVHLIAPVIVVVCIASSLRQTGAMQQVATLLAPHLHAPNFIKNMNEFVVKENTPIGEHIYTLEAQAPAVGRHRPYQILYGIEGTQLFSVDKATGYVRVAQPIDREQTSDSVTFRVNAKAVYNTNLSPEQPMRLETGPLTQLTITVLIVDENDNPPKVERVRIGRTVYNSDELTQQTTSNILHATGNMPGSFTKSPLIKLNLSESTPVGSVVVDVIEAVDVDKASTEPLRSICLNCEPEFELVSATDNLLNDRLNTTLKLADQLIHVPRNNLKQLHVIVNDGKFNSSIVFEITIEDVQNKPPQFIGSTTFIVNERAPIDTTIATIQALDGDVTSPEDLVLYGAANLRKQGRPILFDFISPAGSSTSNLLGFRLHPLTGQLQVADKLDREAYLSSNGVLGLRVRAREMSQEVDLEPAEREDLYETLLNKLSPRVDLSADAQSEAEITVILADSNDNGPHWLNSTEIMALNMNESPVWYNNLPADKDVGRMYQIYVRENSLAGTPITLHNDMFVYDLDNGDNAEFNVSLVNSFNLFDVEPKQVSGFALITLKLASNNGERTRLLDYENVNERSFIIQLSATETRTNERFSSRAQVQINVLDINDNAPVFKEVSYTANIREDAPAGKTVTLVQATDRDEVSKQLSYQLHGQSAHLFDINHKTGLVSVARCGGAQNETNSPREPQPAYTRTRPFNSNAPSKQCIDFEQQRAHHMMIEASDGELSSKVPLTVFIDDANDNPPVFTLPIIDVVIEEGSDRFDPPVRIEVKDADQTSVPSYSIIEGNFEGLFSINNLTGELQLTRPIRIAHDELSSGAMQVDFRQQQQPMNKMTLIVQTSDGLFTANATVRIDVLDSNDNAPKFLRPQYNAEISETASPGQVITTVRAIDSDRGNNARVSYTLERGSHGQFEVDETTGVVRVAPNAKRFDTSKRDNYTLVIVAYDHSTAPKSTSISVNIKVINSRRKAPEFEPKVQRANVLESTPNNTIFYRMTVSESDVGENSMMQLVFEPGPIEALDKDGQQVVDNERLETMFSVSTNTGDVIVSSTLDHSYASYVNLTLYVSVRQVQNYSSSPELIQEESAYVPRSVGYLIINVADENTIPPVFAAPWSPQQPELAYQMIEELPVGSILTQLVANDADSKISYFKIEPPNEYFELTSPQSGTIVNKKIVDYDMLMSQNFMTPASLHHLHHHHGTHHRSAALTSVPGNNIIQFNVFAYDSGWPQLSAKATISVEILPTNDWDCKFDQSVYEVRVKENPLPDTLIVQVRASDLDYGEQHNTIRYQLVGEHRDLFNIDPRTGLVTVSSKGSVGLDRERLGQSNLTLVIVGRDDSVQPALASLPGPQQQSLRSGKPNPGSTGARICSAALKIQVEDINDNPALFSQRIYETTAYDTDNPDVPLVKLFVRDDDTTSSVSPTSRSFVPTNTFTILSGNNNDRFNITSTGLIYATKPLSETMLNSGSHVQLRVQVLQQSPPSSSTGIVTKFTDECLVRINFAKMNRFSPEWRHESLKSAMVKENAKSGTLVAQLSCFDRDYEQPKGSGLSSSIDFESNLDSSKRSKPEALSKDSTSSSMIRYWIKSNGSNVVETNEFRIDTTTGNLYTRIELDRETQEYYHLIVACEDNGKPQSLTSIAPLFVIVLDENDNEPEFVIPKGQGSGDASRNLAIKKRRKLPTIRFATEEHQSKGIPVGQLKAVDRDLDNSKPLIYCILEGNDFQEFNLDRVTGILYTNSSLDREKQSSYDLLVTAVNDGSSCEARVAAYNQPVDGPDKVLRKIQSLREHKLNQEIRSSFVIVQIDVLDINDNAPVFKRQTYRAGVHQRSSMGTIITQVTAYDPDFGLNGTLNYRISEILMYKTNSANSPYYSQSSRKYETSNADQPVLSKPIKLVQYPFRIDQQGNVYAQQLLTQYQLMSMFVLQIEASEQAEPWRTASTKLEIYLYETSSQLKIRINLHPRLIEAHKPEIETLLSNATKFNAIINRARSYYGTTDTPQLSNNPVQAGGKRKPATNLNDPKGVPTLDLTTANLNNNNNVPLQTNDQYDESSYSNIHLIFVDNFRIVNPNIVIEKFDLTSAQLFTPQSILKDSSAIGSSAEQSAGGEPSGKGVSQGRTSADSSRNEVSSLIDKIALASIEAAHYHADPTGFRLAADWLENPAVIFVCLSSLLIVIGFLICIVGCCCSSRIKDHIIKVAMQKLVKQQNLQAKINERVLAAANAAAANGHQMGQGDYMLPSAGFMSSSFDTTKGCITNNNDNMSMLQHAIQPGEFLPDPNYSTLNGHINLGAHYYDASKLEQGEEQQVQELNCENSNQINGSIVSMVANGGGGGGGGGCGDDDEVDPNECARRALAKGSGATSHLFGNGTSGGGAPAIQQMAQRQRQQVPNGDTNH